jgi:hypothetical protein
MADDILIGCAVAIVDHAGDRLAAPLAGSVRRLDARLQARLET